MGFRPLPPQWLQELAEAMPVHTPGSGSDGVAVFLHLPPIVAIGFGETFSALLMIGPSGGSDCQRGIVGFVARKQGPGDPCILVGKCYGRDIGMSPFSQFT